MCIELCMTALPGAASPVRDWPHPNRKHPIFRVQHERRAAHARSVRRRCTLISCRVQGKCPQTGTMRRASHWRNRDRRASTGRGGIGNRMVFPVSRPGQRNGSRALVPPASVSSPRPQRKWQLTGNRPRISNGLNGARSGRAGSELRGEASVGKMAAGAGCRFRWWSWRLAGSPSHFQIAACTGPPTELAAAQLRIGSLLARVKKCLDRPIRQSLAAGWAYFAPTNLSNGSRLPASAARNADM